MGPDDGVQKVLKTGVASMGSYGVCIGVWARGGKVFAEGRVFARDPSPELQGIVETLRVETKNVDLAVVLLEMQIEKYGQLNPIHWWPATDTAILVGQRVWVADPEVKGGRATGVVASVPDDFLAAGGGGGFEVLLEGENKVVTCCNERRGSQWNFED